MWSNRLALFVGVGLMAFAVMVLCAASWWASAYPVRCDLLAQEDIPCR